MSDDHNFLTPDGGVWHTGPAAPNPLEAEAQAAQARQWTLEADDILGVRGMTRVDPPLDEEWIVVTFVVRDRWGDTPGQLQALTIGGRRWDVAPPPEATLAAAESAEQPPAVAKKAAKKGDA